MNISRDIVKDLVAVYLAGDASADTRALVESYLKTDPELARDVEAARATTLGLPRDAPADRGEASARRNPATAQEPDVDAGGRDDLHRAAADVRIPRARRSRSC